MAVQKDTKTERTDFRREFQESSANLSWDVGWRGVRDLIHKLNQYFGGGVE